MTLTAQSLPRQISPSLVTLGKSLPEVFVWYTNVSQEFVLGLQWLQRGLLVPSGER